MRKRTSRDAENPKVGDVFESKNGNRWRVTGRSVTGRVLVKRAGSRFDGELMWTPAMLAKLKEVRGKEEKAVTQAVKPELEKLTFPSGASLVDRILGKSRSGEQLSMFRDPGKRKRRYYVYVIEQIQGGKRVFYVGQTGKTPRERYRDHLRHHYGYTRGAVRLRLDLTKKVNPLYARTDAERLERVIAKTLRKRGLRVQGGH